MILKETLSEIGKFQKTHALRGELNALLDVDEDFFDQDDCILIDMDGIMVPFFVETVRQKGKDSFLVKLDNIGSEYQAKEFVNKVIYADKAAVDDYYGNEEDEDGMYSSEFVGFEIIDETFGKIGVIDYVDLSTDNPLFEVVDDEDNTVLIPVADEYVIDVQPEQKLLKVNLPQGLISLNKK
jgi:16S rRNA processing protein RimM